LLDRPDTFAVVKGTENDPLTGGQEKKIAKAGVRMMRGSPQALEFALTNPTFKLLLVGQVGSTLAPGEQFDVGAAPSKSAASLRITMPKQNFDKAVSSFVIWELSAINGRVVKAAFDFEVVDPERKSTIKGKIRFNSNYD